MERNDDNNEVIRNARKKAKDNKENFTKDKEENKELRKYKALWESRNTAASSDKVVPMEG